MSAWYLGRQPGAPTAPRRQHGEESSWELIIVGGHEKKDGERGILDRIAQAATTRKGALVLVTVATEIPEQVAAQYLVVFQKLGVKPVMVPGLGLIENVVIDAHVTERGRMERLLSAVAQNTRHLDLGIDEDTAIVCSAGRRCRSWARGPCTSWMARLWPSPACGRGSA